MRLSASVLGIVAAVVCLGGEAEPVGAWPEGVTYLGTPRDARWLDAVYAHFRTRIARIEGVWVDVSEPKRCATEVAPGVAFRPIGQVVSVLGEKDCIVRLSRYDRATYARLREVAGQYSMPIVNDEKGQLVRIEGIPVPADPRIRQWHVVAIGTCEFRGRQIVRCVPLPSVEPLSREAFVKLLADGHKLYQWQSRQQAAGRQGGSYPVWSRRYLK